MASPNLGTGKGGKSFQDRKLAADVRNKALQDVHAVLKGIKAAEKFSDYKKAMLLKLAPSCRRKRGASCTAATMLNAKTGSETETPISR